MNEQERTQLESLTETMWDLREQLHIVEMLRAAIMNKLKGEHNE